MTLVIENGSGVAGANSYVSVNDASVFFSARELSIPSAGHLLQAADFIENLSFAGSTTHDTQIMSFPRTGIFDLNKRPYTENAVPRAVINAQLWLSNYIRDGFSPSAVATQAIKKEKVDSLEVEFFGAGETSNTSPLVQYGLTDLPNFFNSISHLLLDDSLTDQSTDCFANGRTHRA